MLFEQRRIAAFSLAFYFVTAFAAAGDLSYSRTDNGIFIEFDGVALGKYVIEDEHIPRPYFAELRAPDGTKITRNFPPVAGVDATDHSTMHPGLWIAFGDLNGVDFWRNQGRIRHDGFIADPVINDGQLSFAVKEEYLGPDGEEVCRGVNAFSVSMDEQLSGTKVMWQTTLESADTKLRFGPQHEMGLAFRIASPLVVKGGSGRILGSHGGINESGNWGRAGQWWDYSGKMNGRHIGILVAADSRNTRPVWSHARDDGFLAMNPTGPPHEARDVPSVPFVIEAGESLRMKYAVLLRSAPRREAGFAEQAASVIQGQLQSWNPRTDATAGSVKAVPTFECMSLYWGVEAGGSSRRCEVKYRPVGQVDWMKAQDLWFDRKHGHYRGSFVNLKHGTEYEFSLRLESQSSGESIEVRRQARTWDNCFPIASTKSFLAGTTNTPFVITEGGAEDGYRHYVAADEGTTIDVNDSADHCVEVDADHVIIRGLTCRGARIDGVRVGNHHHVVIEGCDISGWGRRDPNAGTTVRLGGKDVAIPETLGAHLDAGIHVDGTDAEQIVIQGNHIHHARYTANNWTQVSPHFSSPERLSTHPQGPNVIVFAPRSRGRHVIR